MYNELLDHELGDSPNNRRPDGFSTERSDQSESGSESQDKMNSDELSDEDNRERKRLAKNKTETEKEIGLGRLYSHEEKLEKKIQSMSPDLNFVKPTSHDTMGMSTHKRL